MCWSARLLGLGLGGQANAATDTKKTQPVARKADPKAESRPPRSRPQGRCRRRQAAAKGAPKTAQQGRPAAKPCAPRRRSKKSMRKVSMADVDPTHLALYSASALVIDQETGQSLLEKQSGIVVPIASISKLMTAMVVLDAKLDMNEVITIGDDDVDGLKGTRSRLPVGTAMTRETAMLLALMSSENRAANSLGRHYPGGLPAFVRAMNRKAQALGMAQFALRRTDRPVEQQRVHRARPGTHGRRCGALSGDPHLLDDRRAHVSTSTATSANSTTPTRWSAATPLGDRCLEDRLHFRGRPLPGHAGARGRQAGRHRPARFRRQDDAGR